MITEFLTFQIEHTQTYASSSGEVRIQSFLQTLPSFLLIVLSVTLHNFIKDEN